MLRTLAGLALAVLISGSLTGCQTDAAALKVGDCVSYQSGTDADGNNTLETVVVDCAQPHDGEIFNSFAMPGATFPGYFAIGDAQQDECQSAFTDYVGVDWEHSTYTIDYAGPTEQTWATGDHQIVCTLRDAADGKLTGSARNSAH
jgi:hypothetical protein